MSFFTCMGIAPVGLRGICIWRSCRKGHAWPASILMGVAWGRRVSLLHLARRRRWRLIGRFSICRNMAIPLLGGAGVWGLLACLEAPGVKLWLQTHPSLVYMIYANKLVLISYLLSYAVWLTVYFHAFSVVSEVECKKNLEWTPMNFKSLKL